MKFNNPKTPEGQVAILRNLSGIVPGGNKVITSLILTQARKDFNKYVRKDNNITVETLVKDFRHDAYVKYFKEIGFDIKYLEDIAKEAISNKGILAEGKSYPKKQPCPICHKDCKRTLALDNEARYACKTHGEFTIT